jgi:hypothetical protein
MICDHDAWTNALNVPCLSANIIKANQLHRWYWLLLMIITTECVTLFSTNSGWLISQDERLYSVKSADFAANQWLTTTAALQHPKLWIRGYPLMQNCIESL